MAQISVPIKLDLPIIQNISEASPLYNQAYNVYTGLDSGIYRRPGLELWFDLGTAVPIDGVYWWATEQMLLVASNQKLYKITDTLGSKVEITPTAQTTGRLLVNKPVVFDLGFSTDYKVVFANGTELFYTDGATNYVGTRTGPNPDETDAPYSVTHVAFLDLYTIVNDVDNTIGNAGQFFYSSLADLTQWAALDTDVAYTNPDTLTAVHVKDRELILVGPKSIESWYNDGVSPFSRNDAACIESGCSAPYSFAYCNNTWYWLDDKRQFVRREGRSAVPLMSAFNIDIQQFTKVDDAKATVIVLNGYWYYIITFPFENRTFVYNATVDRWEGEWTFWNRVTAEHDKFLGNNYTFCDTWNIHAIGSRRDGKVYKLKETLHTDDTDIIRAVKQTGTFNFGTSDNKWGTELLLNIRMGATSSLTGVPILKVRWKNDNRQWGAYKEIKLNATGQTDNTIRIKAPGRFRTRKYEFVFTDNSPFELLSAEQVLDVQQ